MNATLDISLYPLKEGFRQIIIGYILRLKNDFPFIEIETNGMSTQVYGEYEVIMDLLNKSVKPVLEKHQAMFVFKLTADKRTVESLPDELK